MQKSAYIRVTNAILIGVMGLLLASPVFAQLPTDLTNADFSRWNQGEPENWQTNNVYDEQGKLLRTLVEPAGPSGARLLARRVVYRTDAPALTGFGAGQLRRAFIPYGAKAGKPIQLDITYRFAPDSLDVLLADLSLTTRDSEATSMTPAKACSCTLTSSAGSFPASLPAAPASQTLRVSAVFAQANEPGQVPPGCLLFVWTMQFRLANPAGHAHENSVAVIEKIQFVP